MTVLKHVFFFSFFFLQLLGLTIVLSENITLSYGTPEH